MGDEVTGFLKLLFSISTFISISISSSSSITFHKKRVKIMGIIATGSGLELNFEQALPH